MKKPKKLPRLLRFAYARTDNERCLEFQPIGKVQTQCTFRVGHDGAHEFYLCELQRYRAGYLAGLEDARRLIKERLTE